MASFIAWLDTSAEEQRRVRELIRLFAQQESRDELGIGQIRDVFSDSLFPGTSVIQTRARYFLLVPWIFREAGRGISGPVLAASAERRERRLVEALPAEGDMEGLIGRRTGPAVKILPSAIYWSGLARFGILTRDVGRDQLLGDRRGRADDGVEELAARGWPATGTRRCLRRRRASPAGSRAGGFALRAGEAGWLRERIVDAAPGTLLAHLLDSDEAPDADSAAPWEDGVCARAPAGVRELMEHARLFSLAVHGAALLYILLVGRRYEEAGYTAVDSPVEGYVDRLEEWAQDCADQAAALIAWDREAMWEHVGRVNPRVGPATRLFVDSCFYYLARLWERAGLCQSRG